MKPLLNVLNGKTEKPAPMWLMRQAGRYLPEYRALRAEKGGFLEMAFDPDAACEITMQPIRRYQFDAAIIFSDILTIPYALGQDLKFVKGEGPKLKAVTNTNELDQLHKGGFDMKMAPVYAALETTKAQLAKEGFDQTALIGFAGAPWTVATYMVEGGGSKDHINVKAAAYADDGFFDALIDLVVDATAQYLIAQVNAGAEVLKIFDSWSGALSPDQFERWSIAPIKAIVEKVREPHPDVPIIGFPRGAGLMYPDFVKETKVNACAIDTNIPLEWAAEHIQPLCPIQGNLDPAALLTGGKALEKTASDILNTLSNGPFIFNLGHGVNKETPPEHVAELVRIVKEYDYA